MTVKHVVLGTGAIGRAVAEELIRRGDSVRIVNRSGQMQEAPPGAEIVAADLYQPVEVKRVTRGATVVYQSAQPHYHEWPTEFPALQKSIIDGLAGTGAKLVIVENLYMYGDTDGKPLTEDLSSNAHTRKGRVRAALSEAALAAHRDGKLRVALGRGSDYFAAWAALAMGNLEQALEFGQRSVDMAIATDNMDCICTGLACLGYINLELGRIPEAAAAFEKGIERSDVSGAMISKLNGQAGLAMTQFAMGHPEAIGDLEDVILSMKLYEIHVAAASANHMLGMCLMQIGELERASGSLTQAVDFYRRSRMYPFLTRSLWALAELKDRQGQAAEAWNLRTEAESLRPAPGKTP
jgi:tetratricopeptide (TPR) repeat protein